MTKLVGWHADPDHEILLEAVENMSCGFLGRQPDGTVVFVNDRFLEWLGYDRREVEGESMMMFFPEDFRETAYREMQEIDKGDLRARLAAMRRKDGTTFPVLSLPSRLFDGRGVLEGVVSVIVDLGAVQTAKATVSEPGSVRSTLDRIALELQAIGLAADLPLPPVVTLEAPELASLTRREKEVLSHLASGERPPAIAELLKISPHTVRNHLKAIFRKLDVRDQAELLRLLRSFA